MSGVKTGKGKDEKNTKGKIPSPFSLSPIFLFRRLPRHAGYREGGGGLPPDLMYELESSYTVKPR